MPTFFRYTEGTDEPMPPAPIFYHALDFPTNCYNPWALRAFVRLLAEDIGRPADFPKAPDQRIYPLDTEGHVTVMGNKIDTKARCVALVIYTPKELRQFLKEWPTVTWAEAVGLPEGSLAAQAVEGVEAVYVTMSLAELILDALDNVDEEA